MKQPKDGDSPRKIAAAKQGRGREFAKFGGAGRDLIRAAKEAYGETPANAEFGQRGSAKTLNVSLGEINQCAKKANLEVFRKVATQRENVKAL